MPTLEPRDPDFETRVRASFSRMRLMQTIEASLLTVTPGEVEIELPFRADLTQQHGFLAAAIITAIADTACGFAAMSLMPAGATVLTVEYKVNFLAPARGDRMIARGRVNRAGRILTVCAGEVFATTAGTSNAVATMLATMMTIEGRPEVDPVTWRDR